MLMIRLQRIGRRNHAEFRVVVTEHARATKSSSYLEIVGNYNPHTDSIVIDGDKVKGWIAKGAKPSETVHNLLVTKKIIDGKKINVLPKKTPIIKEVAPVAGGATA
ncbi:MAG: 30S ribosomal protein S16 [Candidatus Pacebacteria bacterium]|nr:30S ribosomal protein S16 [Candidatus Paceibacterota bacterium]